MSVDSYFCICCLSTNDLLCLYGSDEGSKYIDILLGIFGLKPSEDLYDLYICYECKQKLDQTLNFKNLVYNSLKSLQTNGLLKLVTESNILDCVMITKNVDPYDEENQNEYKYSEWLDLQLFSQSDDELCSPLDARIKEENVETEDVIVDTKYVDNQETEEVKPKRIIIKWSKPKRDLTPYTINPELKCDVCNEVSPNTQMFHKHMREHYPNYICSTCGKAFVSVKSMNRHLTTHRVKSYKCTICGSCFSNHSTYIGHKKRKHGGYLYKCTKCEEKFLNYDRRAKHLAKVHGEDQLKYACPICSKKFLVSTYLRTHMRDHRKEKDILKCNECKYKCHVKGNLIEHMATHFGTKL